jgi:hypothetical protein
MIRSVRNSPAVVQYVVYNELDCIRELGQDFGIEMLELIHSIDGGRLVDVRSGYGMGDPAVTSKADAAGDVHDLHDYPDPQDPKPTDTQYAMVSGRSAHEWKERA